MNTPPSPPTSELLPGPRFALDRRVCVIANHWGARRLVGLFFGMVSRLGDGVFWYALMVALAVLGGQRGIAAAAHMAVTGLAAYIPARRASRIDPTRALRHD